MTESAYGPDAVRKAIRALKDALGLTWADCSTTGSAVAVHNAIHGRTQLPAREVQWILDEMRAALDDVHRQAQGFCWVNPPGSDPQWHDEDRLPSGKLVCRNCGQLLPEKADNEARVRFDNNVELEKSRAEVERLNRLIDALELREEGGRCLT